MGRISSALCLCSLLLLTACDRSFSDVGEARVSVVSPDISIATTEASVNLELLVSSVRDVTRVQSGGIEFSHTANSEKWTATLPLNLGLNQFLIESTVDDGPTGIDTVNVFHLNYEFESATDDRLLIFTTGGHTTTRLQNDDLILIGGTSQPGGGGAFDALIWRRGSVRFGPSRGLLSFERVGHSASLLPDGRVLLAGGGMFGDISEVSELVEEIEIYDPATDIFSPIPFVGQPIRRMYHSAIVRSIGGNVFIVLLGGRGDTRYGANPLLDIRRDMRTFQFHNDSLFAISPSIGPFVEFVAGHTQTTLEAAGVGLADRFLISGLRLADVTEGASLKMNFASPAGIDITSTLSMNLPRLRHTAVNIAPGIIAHFNGRGEFIDDVYAGGELFVEEVNSYFSFPTELAALLTPAFGQSANLLSDGRVLLLGGFDASGAGLSTSEFVSLVVQ